MKVLLLALVALAPGKRPLLLRCPAAGEQIGWGEGTNPELLAALESDYHEKPQVIGESFRIRIAKPLVDQASWDERLEAVVCRPAKLPPLKARAKPAPLNTAAQDAIRDEYTVVFRTTPRLVYSLVEDVSARYGIPLERIRQIVAASMCGFSGTISANQLDKLRGDPRVDYIAQDQSGD